MFTTGALRLFCFAWLGSPAIVGGRTKHKGIMLTSKFAPPLFILSPLHVLWYTTRSSCRRWVAMVLLELYSTVVPLSYHRRFGKRRVVPSPASRRGYHSDHHSTHTSVEGEPTCLRYARKGGDLATLFGDFCKRCLCAESWEFIVEVVAYEVSLVPWPVRWLFVLTVTSTRKRAHQSVCSQRWPKKKQRSTISTVAQLSDKFTMVLSGLFRQRRQRKHRPLHLGLE